MKYRQLGHTGLRISELGFGAWGIGGRTEGFTSYGETDDATSLDALRCALDLGVSFFDTSPAYGSGRSEELIGDAFRNDRDRVVIATKAGYASWGTKPDFAPTAIVNSLEGSLRRLKTDYVDLLQLHNPSPALIAREELQELLDSLVRQGKARAWGASMRSPNEAVDALHHCRIPAIQVNLNMMDLRAIDSGLMDAAVAFSAGLIARTPLCFGFLSGTIGPETEFSSGDHRRGWPPAQLQRWRAGAAALLDAVGARPGIEGIQAALRFCLSFPAVSTVIPGMLRPEEVHANVRASDLGPLGLPQLDAVLTINRSQNFFVRS